MKFSMTGLPLNVNVHHCSHFMDMLWRLTNCHIIIIIVFLDPQYSVPEGIKY